MGCYEEAQKLILNFVTSCYYAVWIVLLSLSKLFMLGAMHGWLVRRECYGVPQHFAWKQILKVEYGLLYQLYLGPMAQLGCLACQRVLGS